MSDAQPVVEMELFKFSDETSLKLSDNPRFKTDWPFVYIIYKNKEATLKVSKAYVGETYSVVKRMGEHIRGGKKDELRDGNVIVIRHRRFNKSTTLDFEQYLIKMFFADEHYSLLNGNMGQSASHEYYDRANYREEFPKIWDDMRDRFSPEGLTLKPAHELENTSLFKFSPFTSLTSEQEEICLSIVKDIASRIGNKDDHCTYLVMGGAGTGKTVMAVNMIYRMSNPDKFYDQDQWEGQRVMVGTIGENDMLEEYEGVLRTAEAYATLHENAPGLKPMLLEPMTSMCETMSDLFESIPSMKGVDVFKACGLAKHVEVEDKVVRKPVDVLFVDEGHRLARYHNISYYGSYKKACAKLGFMEIQEKSPNKKIADAQLAEEKKEAEKVNQLDWIMKSSRFRIIFYDEFQSVRGSDIPADEFRASLGIDPDDTRTLREMASEDQSGNRRLKVYSLTT